MGRETGNTPCYRGGTGGKGALSHKPGQEVRTRLYKGDRSTPSVATRVELFQDPHDVTTFILGVWNVYLGGLPVVAHGGGGTGNENGE